MGRGEDLGAGAGLAQTLDDAVQCVRVQAVIDLFDAGQLRRVGVMQHGQQCQRTDGAEGRRSERRGAAQSLFLDLDRYAGAAAADRYEPQCGEPRCDIAQIIDQRLEHVRIGFCQPCDIGGEICRIGGQMDGLSRDYVMRLAGPGDIGLEDTKRLQQDRQLVDLLGPVLFTQTAQCR